MANIKIKYNGEFPNLCRGRLEVWINNDYYDFGRHVLESGGYINEDFEIVKNNWIINKYPKDFPKEYEEELLKIVNQDIPHGCCGGCI